MPGDKFLANDVNGVVTEVRPITVSAGTASASKLVGLNANGQIDPTMIPAVVGTVGGFSFYQATASATWTIVHNLNRRPVVDIVDSAGTVCEGDNAYPDLNTVVVSFSVAFSGYAYLV